MSGPIVRKYGFANFEKIFGEREIQHGADEPESAGKPAESPGAGLPPDLATEKPVDANDPQSAGQMAPSTEFGSTGQ